MDHDRYPALGPKVKVADFDAAMAAVRAVWPGAWCEGSMGAERTWWSKDGDGKVLVAHQWPASPRRRGEETYVRIVPREAVR